MTRRSHLVAWLVLCLAGLLVWPWWCGPERLAERARDDLATLQRTFGPRLAPHLVRAADLSQQGFGHAGVEDLLAGGDPRGALRERYRSTFADEVAGGAERYLEALRLQAHGATLRAVTLLAWWILLLPVALAAVVDGLVERAIKADTFGYQNPAAFSLAGHALIACAMLPVMALAWPVSPPPWLAPSQAGAALLPLRATLAHMQPVFTH